MGTRFYLNTNQAAPVSPSFGVGTPEFGWTSSTSATRCLASTAHVTGDTLATLGPRAITNNTNLLFVQGVTAVLPTGTAFTTSVLFTAYFQCSESAADDNLRPQVRLKVVSEDGATLRQEIRPSTDTSGLEPGTTLGNLAFSSAVALGPIGYTTVAGDRLVIEVGLASQAGVSPSGSVRFGSDGDDLPQGPETGTTFVPWVEFTNLDVFPTMGTPAFHPPNPVSINATIAGFPVEMSDWQFDAVTNEGYRSLTAKIPETFVFAEQGAPIRVWLSDSTEVWAGELALDPDADRGKLQIRAEGYASRLSVSSTRMFYRIDGAGAWVEADAEPHELLNNDKYDLRLKPGLMRWQMGNAGSDSFAANDQAGFVLWVEGGLITRYECLSEPGASYSAFDFITSYLTGPNTVGAVIATHNLTAGSITRASNLSTPADMIRFRVEANTSAASSTRRRHIVSRIKVYGRTIDDNFSASEVVHDVASDVGMDRTLIQDNGLAILPLDWTDDNADLLDYMAELTDWHWEVWGPNADGQPRLSFAPWETNWTVYQSSGVRPNVENLARYNVVRVPYRRVNGQAAFAYGYADSFATDGFSAVYEMDELEHPQSNSNLATAIAERAVDYWSAKRVGGRVELGEVFSEQGEPASGYLVKPGDVITIAERPDLPPQRVVGMSYRQGAVPIAELGDEFNVIRLLAEFQKSRRRRRKKRSRRRNPNVASPP